MRVKGKLRNQGKMEKTAHGTQETGGATVKRLRQRTLGICCEAAGMSPSVAIEQEAERPPALQYANGALTECRDAVNQITELKNEPASY